MKYHTSILELINQGEYELSHLGDGTAVLTSLADSKLITLNKFGTEVVTLIVEDSMQESEERLNKLAASKSLSERVEIGKVIADITDFLQKLHDQLKSNKT